MKIGYKSQICSSSTNITSDATVGTQISTVGTQTSTVGTQTSTVGTHTATVGTHTATVGTHFFLELLDSGAGFINSDSKVQKSFYSGKGFSIFTSVICYTVTNSIKLDMQY